MREQKRKRDEEKKAKMNYLTGGTSGDKSVITNAYLDQILNDEDPFAPKVTEAGATSQVTRIVGEKVALATSSYVVDLQIPAPVSIIYK